jgi:hypothetical protein
VQLWLAERPGLGVNGRQRLFCTLQGGDLSATNVRQMVKRRAAAAGDSAVIAWTAAAQ